MDVDSNPAIGVAYVFVVILIAALWFLIKCCEENYQQNSLRHEYYGNANYVNDYSPRKYLFENYSANYDGERTIDLHGYSVSEAMNIVKNELQNNKSNKQLAFITGQGLHSIGNIPKIKNALIAFLKAHGIKYSINPQNPGRVYVTNC